MGRTYRRKQSTFSLGHPSCSCRPHQLKVRYSLHFSPFCRYPLLQSLHRRINQTNTLSPRTESTPKFPYRLHNAQKDHIIRLYLPPSISNTRNCRSRSRHNIETANMSGSVFEDAAGTSEKKNDPPSSPQPSVPLPPGPMRFDNVEGQTATGAADQSGVAAIVQRWRREDRIRKTALTLRGFAFLFSLISFIITATNQHGYGRSYRYFEEYR